MKEKKNKMKEKLMLLLVRQKRESKKFEIGIKLIYLQVFYIEYN